jgi:hypothetical protein
MMGLVDDDDVGVDSLGNARQNIDERHGHTNIHATVTAFDAILVDGTG